MWKTGILPVKGSNVTVIEASCTSVPMGTCRSFRGGRFWNGRWILNGCDNLEPDVYAHRKILNGRHVLFMGNSMVRQLFLRLVYHVRGIDEMIEHFFHEDAAYFYNGTHDHLQVGTHYNATKSGILNPTFIAEFKWAQGSEFYGKHEKYITDLRVVGYGYNDFNDTELTNSMSNTDRKSTLLMTMSSMHRKEQKDVKGNLTIINRYIEENHPYHIPLAEMAETKVFLRSSDEVHWGCGVYDYFESQMLRQNVKMPRNGDCSDRMNLNSVFMVLKYLQSMPCNESYWQKEQPVKWYRLHRT